MKLPSTTESSQKSNQSTWSLQRATLVLQSHKKHTTQTRWTLPRWTRQRVSIGQTIGQTRRVPQSPPGIFLTRCQGKIVMHMSEPSPPHFRAFSCFGLNIFYANKKILSENCQYMAFINYIILFFFQMKSLILLASEYL